MEIVSTVPQSIPYQEELPFATLFCALPPSGAYLCAYMYISKRGSLSDSETRKLPLGDCLYLTIQDAVIVSFF